LNIVFYDPDDNNVSDDYLSTNITGTDIRWGRWFVDNAFGSELQALFLVTDFNNTYLDAL
jgi:hypothetical protein